MNNILNYNKFIKLQESEITESVRDANGKKIKTGNFVRFEKDGVEYSAKVSNLGISFTQKNPLHNKINITVEIITPISEKGKKIEVDTSDVKVYL